MTTKPANFHTRQTRVMVGGFAASLLVLLLLALINEKNWRPVQYSSAWNVSANFSPILADRIIDQNLDTLWTSSASMSSGMYVHVDLEIPQRLNGLVLYVGDDRRGQPQEWQLKISPDGLHWQTLTPLRHVTYRSMLAIFFRPVTAQSIRIIQTSVSETLAPWVIHELVLLRPVVPWQMSRLTVMAGFVVWGILLIGALLAGNDRSLMRLFPHRQPQRLVVILIVLLMFLPGLLLRISAITQYDLAPELVSRLPIIDFGEPDQRVWLKEYGAIMPEMPAWLNLLMARMFYRLIPEVRSVLMSIPSVFSLILTGLIFIQGSTITIGKSVKNRISRQQQQHRTWEAFIASSVISLAGLPIWLDRQGHGASIALVFLVAYVFLSKRVLYRQGSFFWLPVLALLIVIGYAFEPLVGLFPGVLLCTSGIAAGLPTSAEGSRQIRLARWGLLLLSVLPLVIVLQLSPWRLPDFSLQARMFPHLSESLEYSGLLGGWAWMFWGLALAGGWQLYRAHQRGELRFYGNLFLFALLSNGFSGSHWIPETTLVVLLLLLFAKGMATACGWCVTRLRCQKLAVYHDFLALTGMLLSALYFGGFAYNSLFAGISGLPHAPALVRNMSQAREVNRQLAHLQASTVDCNWVGLLDPELSEYLAQTYAIMPESVRFTDLRRQAEYGRFAAYLIVSATSERATHPDAIAFFTRYYTEYTRSATLTVYRLRAPYANLAQHYFAEDLLGQTGKRRQDSAAPSGKALVATPNDPAGALVSWPVFRLCGDGAYTARFALRVEGGQADAVAVSLEAIADTYTLLSRRELTPQDFSRPGTYQEFELTFDLPAANPAYQLTRLQLRVRVTGVADVYLAEIELIPHNASTGGL